MKTARDKAEEWFSDYAPCFIKAEGNISSLAEFIDDIRKEQDIETKHACISNMCDNFIDNISQVNKIIMNTKAV